MPPSHPAAFAVLLPVKTVGVMGDGDAAGFDRNSCNGPDGPLPVLSKLF
jgi:hypothetical protein